jgi:HAD superfamily hydrolase (TIGR01490 family)
MDQNLKTDTLVLFDMDGTITNGDTFIKFILFDNGIIRVVIAFIIAMCQFSFSKSVLKENVFSFLYRGKRIGPVLEAGERFCSDILPDMLKRSALNRITWHKEQEHNIFIVTASSSIWLSFWCNIMNIDLISTEFEVDTGIFTGKYSGKNCKHEEKLIKIRQIEGFSDYSTIYAYGNSKDDIPMLSIATHRYYDVFKE